ncbi:MAG: hypothetical protein M1836_007491 [Candelina mexicana]|nr:MAG: hypothetical protein M1836_007491 [Candelina mexicana]
MHRSQASRDTTTSPLPEADYSPTVTEMLLINGQFPGPTIEANWGDTIEVKVHNKITHPGEGTALHWHGLQQKATPWYDGAPSVGQCPVAPGSSFTYRFKADSYGTSWYHGHYSAQYVDGLWGPMIIHGPSHVDYDIDLGPIFLHDHYHRDTLHIIDDVTSTSTNLRVVAPTSQNNLINGKMHFDCTKSNSTQNKCSPNAGLSKFKFTSGKTHLLRLANTGAAGMQRFTIDGHTMQIISNDFTPIVPYEVTQVSLGVGQRSDVLVKAIGKPQDTYWMRSTLSANCTFADQPNAVAPIYYEEADTRITPNTTAQPIVDINCANDDLSKTIPLFAMTPEPNPSTTKVVELNFTTNATGHNIWTWNGQTHRANFNHPLLLLANDKNFTYPEDPEWNVYDFGGNETIRIVINNIYQAVHPMHLHGHNMYILSEGPGKWNGTIINPSNPLRRDTHMMRRGLSHLVIQIDANNPGIWPFHCHIPWHSAMGMTMNIMEQSEMISNMQIPMIMEQTCKDWDAWSATHVVDQIDSGV